MKRNDLLEHRAELNAKLAQIVRQLKAVDILLEDSDLPKESIQNAVAESSPPLSKDGKSRGPRRRVAPAHAVRTSPRSSLIDAVQTVAINQPGPFDSVQLLKAIQSEYPEFQLTETKHISSPLSDLVKRGVLVLEQKRIGSKPNIYRAQASK